MEQPPSSRRNFTQSFLPWIVAAGVLGLYLATLASWVTLPALDLTGQVLGWNWWQPKVGRPLYHLLTMPVKALPAGAQLLALNAFAAVCSALTLALLARSVALLPQDRTHDQRARLQDENGLLAVRGNWLPPLLAVLACGLQLSFWEHATAATGEALDLLLFAASIWCLLEFRLGRADKWLSRFALACGLGFANNWAMLGFAPFLFLALVWFKGREFFNFRFLGRLAVWGAVGLLIHLFNPLTASPEFGFSFGDFLTAELGAQKNLLLYSPRGRVLILSFVTLLPLTLIGIRWSSGFGDVSAAGAWLSGFMFRFIHAGFLGVTVYMTFDQAFSPRALGEGRAMLLFYYLGALVIGYCAGYFLLLCGTDEVKAWRKPGPVGKVVNFTLVGVLWLGLVALPGWLGVKNLPSLRAQNGSAVREFAGQLVKGLPGQGTLALSEQPTHLLLVAAYFHGQTTPHILLDGRMLQLTRYHRQLSRRHPGRWPDPGATADTQVLPPAAIAAFLGMQSRSNHVVTLHPPTPAIYLENLYPVPTGFTFELHVYQTNEIVPPPALKTPDAGIASFFTGNEGKMSAGSPDHSFLLNSGSTLLNDGAVRFQRAGAWTNAQSWFDAAAKLNPSNLVAVLNRDFNESLRTGKPSASDPAKIAQELLGPGQTWGSVLARYGPPDEPNFCFALGQLLRQASMPRQAIIQFTRAAELAPTNVAAHLAMADTFIALGLPDRAHAALESARAKPELRAGVVGYEAAFLRLDALHLSLKGQKTEAEKAFVAALQKHPNDLPLLDSLTELYLFTARFTNALALTDAQLKLAPTSPRALVNKGGILIQMKQYEAALPSLDKVIELQPNHPGAHLNRALALLSLNRLDDAAKDYRRVIELAPTTYNGHFGLGEIAWQRKQTADARKHYEAGLKLAPANSPEAKLMHQRLKELSGGK
ncbi:MAG: tetratricopeptide repeat protein [Proteobacteria bacterium]|nr:tetratricopeptide repeat protein [Pseudomonadota bacterium]